MMISFIAVGFRFVYRRQITAAGKRIAVGCIVARRRRERESRDVGFARVHPRKTRKRRLDDHIDELLRQNEREDILRGVAVLDRVVDDHQPVAIHRPRNVARSFLLAVRILRAELLHLQIDLQRMARSVERRLFIHQNDDVLALHDPFGSDCFRHKFSFYSVILF